MKEQYYELCVKNKSNLYSLAINLFIIEMVSFVNIKGQFLNSPQTIELFKWMIMLALFMTIIRVIRPLSLEEWSKTIGKR